MVGSVRFSSIDLKYGCHDRSIRLPIKQSPIVITAPNGCGKTTLVEALVRALFGFESERQEDRRRLESRRPWSGTDMRVTVDVFDDDSATWRIDHQLVDSLLTITSPTGRTESWRRDQKGRASDAATGQIRDRFIEMLGVADRRLYESTLCLHQGAILDTHLGEEILQLAASTYSLADAARRKLAAEAQALLSGHPTGDEKSAEDRQSVEALARQIGDLEMNLAQAGGVHARRADLTARAERLERELDKADAEIGLLEEERQFLLKRQDEEADVEQLREKLHDLEGVESDLEIAVADLEALERADTPKRDTPSLLPADLKERAERIEELWRERKKHRMAISKRSEDLEGGGIPSPMPIIAATLTALAGLPAYQAGMSAAAIALSGAGLAFLAILLVRQRRAAGNRHRAMSDIEVLEGQLADVKDELSELLAEIPEGESLRRERLAEMVRELEGRAGAQSKLEQAAANLDTTAALAREMLDKWSDVAIPSPPKQVLLRVQEEIITARDDLETKGEQTSTSASPSAGAPTSSSLEALEITIEERHQARDELIEDLETTRRAVIEEGRLARSPLAMKRQLAALRYRLEEVRDRQAALQRASELIGDAYDEYREHDEQRLIDAISHALSGLTSGELGPLVANEGLEDSKVRLGKRALPLECPPLGHGDYHAALLAIRLGVADFLAELGIRPPLILDEPFAYLDEGRCVQLWQILNRIARRSQVIVATYNQLLLDQIGVSPDVVLDQPPAHPLFAGVA
jgi:DNA repair exonuclease SbcCD ATPase subunit